MADDHRTNVAVFGGGIAGLTAAHELIERGFDVTVYEKTPPLGPHETICGVGGMARTQIGRVELPGKEPDGPATMRETERVVELGPAIVTFAPDSDEVDADARPVLDKIAALMKESPTIRHVLIRGWMAEPGSRPTDEPGDRIDHRRAQGVLQYLVDHGVAAERLATEAWGFGWSDDPNRTPRERSYVDLRIEEDLVPGEHGFRFFPAFYRHVFDTMLRIPIAQDGFAYVETGRTVLDNVIPTHSQGVNFGDRKSFVLPRRPVESFREAFDLLQQAYDVMGFTTSDVQRFGLKLFKYTTSCSERRRDEYEDISWYDYLEGDLYSERYRRYLDSAPQLLVAMRAKESDARTIGNIAVQLMLDQLRGRQRTDGTLNAPSTLAWFEPWVRYLTNQGVKFENAELVTFERDGEDLLPVVQLPSGEEEMPDGIDYCVVALSAQGAQDVVRKAGLAGGDFDKIRRLDLGDNELPNPGGIVDHLSGIQYYFKSDVKFVAGHTVFPDSEWGLSAIAQPQFWVRRRGRWDGYLGLLSVDIGNWHQKSSKTDKRAWESTKQEIADEVWRQIRDTLSRDKPVPEPIIYHLDENIVFSDNGEGPPARNETPLIINRTGRFHERPGEPDPERGYRLQPGRIVFAGTYMQTYTRMTTMEAANESGRHAVNAILENEHFEGDRCMIADPEQYEIDDLKWLVEIDRGLWELGLPHFVDILRLEELPESLYSPETLARMLAPHIRMPGGRARGLRVTPA